MLGVLVVVLVVLAFLLSWWGFLAVGVLALAYSRFIGQRMLLTWILGVTAQALRGWSGQAA
jgi:hypothetical protein